MHEIGSLAPLASVTLVRTVSFSIYTNSKGFYGEVLQRLFGPNAVTARGSDTAGTLPKPGDALRWALGGATAGAAITAIACMSSLIITLNRTYFKLIIRIGPFEFTKLSAQIEYLMSRSRAASMDEPSTDRVKYEAKGTAQAARYIIKTRGFRGLYSGFHLHFGEQILCNNMGCTLTAL